MTRKLTRVLATTTPCCCTCWGRRGEAAVTLFCTCTWAMSGLTPAWKVAVMVTWPVEALVEEK